MRLIADHAKCTGCGTCTTICPLTHFHENNPVKAALKVDGSLFPVPGGYRVHVCDQCGVCANVCPVQAIHLDSEHQTYWVAPDECTLCGACVDACPYGVINEAPGLSFVVKCDSCGECTKYCGPGVLSIPLQPGQNLPDPHVFPTPAKPAPGQLGGYAGRLLYVDLSTRSSRTLPLPSRLAKDYLGGRGFAARLLYDEIPAGADPLGPLNKVILASGPLAGLFVPGAGKATFAAKSPLTGSYGDSNVGGHLASELKFAGYDAIILEGMASSPVYLYVCDDTVEVRDAGDLWGSGRTATEKALKTRLGNDFQIAAIGPAGERMVKYACVGHDWGREAGRTGIGAVLGSKQIKAIALRGSKPIPVAEEAELIRLGKAMFQECLDSPGRAVWARYGTAGVVTWSNEIGSFPTRNFRSGQLPGYEALSGELMREHMVIFDKACGLCPVPCGKYSHSRDIYVEGPEYETSAMLGGMCGLTNMDDIAHANWLCDDLGLDTISSGSCVAFAMECYEKGIIGQEDTGGLDLRWGDPQVVFTLLQQIARREGLGAILAEGTRFAAQRWGGGSMDFAMQVKGMEITGYDSHRAPAMLLAYSTADIGAHHNRAWAIAYDLEAGRDTVDGKAAKVVELQHIRPLFDSLGACRLQWIELGLSLENYAPILSAIWGSPVSWQELLKASERTWNLTRLWWIREKPGFGRQDDQPPARWVKEPAQGGPTDGSFAPQAMVDRMLDEYYELRGWNRNGIPTRTKLDELGL
jgi:aldehyde:ferredoxin oxidoreductase